MSVIDKEAKAIAVQLQRNSSQYDSFEVAYTEGMNVLMVLNYIYENLDRTISYPICLCHKYGKCGACAIRLNGKNVLACAVLVNPGDKLIIEPIKNKQLIKDLVVK